MICLGDPTAQAAPIVLTSPARWPGLFAALDFRAQNYVKAAAFDPKPGAHLILPDAEGKISVVFFMLADAPDCGGDRFLAGKLAAILPDGRYRLEGEPEEVAFSCLGLLLSAYRFSRYRPSRAHEIVLETPPNAPREKIETIVAAVAFGRDLINTPANDMGPAALEAAALGLARQFGARARAIVGADLLAHNFPLIHAVGRAAAEAPRLVDIKWRMRGAGPKVVLVGKGVCFDTGGLDIKPDAAMLLMKKDMGGAATALAAAYMIMQANLPLRLRVILPIVENSISADSFRPGDIYRSRAGATVEIGNTDAEGRLILADALALADEDEPDLLIDFATLTGAARVALGPDLPPFFTNDEALAAEIAAAGQAVDDPVWRLPLWRPYDCLLDGKVAELNNVASNGFAGSIVAALFLQRFVVKTKVWAHFDVYGWNPATKPGRPEGGEIQAARLVFELLQNRLAPKQAI